MRRRKRISDDLNLRDSEQPDCVHYDKCLTEIARTNRGQQRLIPCHRCDRYKKMEPKGLDGFRQRGDWNYGAGL